MILRGAFALLCVGIGAALWLRFAPLPVDQYHRMPATVQEAGDWAEAGVFEAVRQVPDPKARLAELDRIIRAAPRTLHLEGSLDEGLLTYVSRSALLGVPAISNLWIEGDRIHLRAHQAFGLPDFGGTRALIEGWLARAGLAAP